MSKKAKQVSSYAVLTLVGALILGGIFTVLAMNTFRKVPITVAARDINPYSETIVAEDFKTIEISKGDKKNFQGFIVDPNILIGKVATSSIMEGQPVKTSQFINPEDAESVQSLVGDTNNRGLYLPLSFENALNGDLKAGGIYDFYLTVDTPKPIAGNENNTEWTTVLLQKSYEVKKIVSVDEDEYFVFFEFPKEESEKYVMLKQLLLEDTYNLMAVMPNPIHEPYDSGRLQYTEFFGGLTGEEPYFTSISEKKEKTEDSVVNPVNPVNPVTPPTSDTKPTDENTGNSTEEPGKKN